MKSIYRGFSRLPIRSNRTAVITSDLDRIFGSVKSGSTVAIQGVASTPTPLIRDFCNYVHNKNLSNVKIFTLLPLGEAVYHEEPYASHFHTNYYFMGASGRAPTKAGNADYIPVFLNDVSRLYRRGVVKLDLLMINVTDPDKFGYCSMGPSVETVLGAVETAKVVVGQMNPLTPFTYGDSLLHLSRFDFLIPKEMPVHTIPVPQADEAERTIGKYIAENLVDDGSTLQMGIGSIPDIVLSLLHSHKDLGIHTEMFSDGVADLFERGNITNALKKLKPGILVTSFILGSEKIFKFIDHNTHLLMKDAEWTNFPENIAQNPKVVAINSCIEIDLFGQVCSDSIGTTIYSGFGGQLDFLKGAAMSLDGKGKAILAMTSTTKKGESKIVPFLKKGAGVVTPLDHVHYVVTEYGIAYLFGKTVRERAKELIRIAHPKFRGDLERTAHEHFK